MLVDLEDEGMMLAHAWQRASHRGWEAELQLRLLPKNGKTVLADRRHRGPLTVQRPFYPEGPVCHVYLLHPPGGAVAGDRLAIDIQAERECAALLTTPAAGKFYRSTGDLAQQSVCLRIAEGASLEWLPQETIVYEGAHMTSDLRVDLGSGARFIGWDIVVLGRPAASEGFTFGEAKLSVQITRAGRPVYLERATFDAEAFAAPWGLNGHPAFGTLFASPTSADDLEAVQKLIGDASGRGVTRIGDVLICRGLDRRADRLRAFFQRVWATVRRDVTGRDACAPRIWAT